MLGRLRAAMRGGGAPRQPLVVEVFTRVGCGLCEHAEQVVHQEARSAEIRVVDVDSDPSLARRYTDRVPVVAVNGREVAEGPVRPGAIRRALRTAARSRPGERSAP